MVDTFNQRCWPLSPTRWCYRTRRNAMRMEKQNSASEAYMKWAGYRESNRDSGRGEAFFLDIPFYRTHWPGCAAARVSASTSARM